MRTLYLICFILLTSSCGNQSIRPDRQDYVGLFQAQTDYENQNFIASAPIFANLYNTYLEDRFALLAADSYLQQQNYQQAKVFLNRVKSNNNPLKNLIQAELSFVEGYYDYKIKEINGKYRSRYLKIKSQSDSANQDYLNAALNYIELSGLDRLTDYTNQIISNLMSVSYQELDTVLFNLDLSQHQQGWIEAAIVIDFQDQESINRWKEKWQQHPAIALFNQSKNYKNIAVLLPLSGKYRNISKSIQEGMVAALHDHNNKEQRLNFFDTGSNGETFSYAWYGAIESGAEFIIGPLDKNSIEQMSQINSSALPVMSLNLLAKEVNQMGYYQFGLSKEDEISNVAKRLIDEQNKRVMLLAPESEKGREQAVFFEKEFSLLGGQVVSYAFYPESTHDYTREIKQAIGLNNSIVRARNLKSIIGESFKNKPQIRPDIDAIFILAKTTNARLIKPQLKFFQAKNIPVYATSQVQPTKNNPELDKDLNGIKFCQSKFIIAPEILQNALNFDVKNLTSNKKFFAFGYDAALLFPRLEWMQTMQSQKFEGLSGILNVDGNGKIHRTLAWAEYKKGVPRLLPELVEPSKSEDFFEPVQPQKNTEE